MKFNLNSENINYLKITYKDNDGFAHCVKTAIRYLNDFEILVSKKSEEFLQISLPQEVEIGIACDNGLYKAKTILKRIESDNPYILFSLKKPEEIEYQQNREFFRIKIQEDANIIFEENGQEIAVSALTYDISANGVRIELDNNFAFPENVRLLLFLLQRQIDLQAKYIRTDDDDNVIKASFSFINIAPADLDYISQICIQKQIQERRKNLL